MRFEQQLSEVFKTLGIPGVTVKSVGVGPTLGRFAIKVPEGTRSARVCNLSDDVALAMGVTAVWFTKPIAPWTFGLDIPRRSRKRVDFNTIRWSGQGSNHAIPLYIGSDVTGQHIVPDLADLPHLLIAGRTGSGKSVCLHSIISSIHERLSAYLVLIDPKHVEFEEYRNSPLLKHPVVTESQTASEVIHQLLEDVDKGFRRLAEYGVKDVSSLAELGVPVRRTVVVIDELADLLLDSTAETEKDLIRIAQKGRAVGIHLVLATQRPTVDVVSGLLKANIPSRIAFQVTSKLESRIVLDQQGAESLLGRGDFLFQSGQTLLRGQCAI